ncbi:MAG: Uncharacterized protein G01um10143_87 [Parcubacteria group bacterium Gr01-1014_3]|nr:MAG: Uncharacterized protein G01um10143_87 [Parcubacteria group bacterium Gr01-1014_3]
MTPHHDKIARMLRMDKHVFAEFDAEMERATGKINVIKKIAEENEAIVTARLDTLGLSRSVPAQELFDALISKVEADDLNLFKALEMTGFDHVKDAGKVVDMLKKIHPSQKGFFLKHEKARQLLIAEPPKNILKALGYQYVDEMLQKEDLLEIFCALRFLEEADWLNKVFFKQYESLRLEDFEEREIVLKALSPKWAKAAEKFVAKKYHNVSHLKEMGVIFVIPIFLGISGETLRLVCLLLHYLNEVQFYSGIIQKMGNGHEFAKKLISLLRGDVTEHRLPEMMQEFRRPRFLVVQRYLSKDDENDWRLFEPRVNPEALHWKKAEIELTGIPGKMPEFKNGLDFWESLGTVGDFFKTDTGVEVLVSFNIVDTVMALVMRKYKNKYLYHQQEALWNKIFSNYFNVEELEKRSKANIFKGWFEV